MTAYLIVYGADPSDRFAAYSYPTRAAAREASLKLTPNATTADHGNGGGCAYVIETAADITLSGTVLVAVYNALTNANLKKFETRQVGVERLLKHLPEFAQKAAPVIEEKKNMDTNETEDASAAPAKRRGRPPAGNAAEKKVSEKINPGSGRAKFVKMIDGSRTLAQIRSELGLNEKQLKSAFDRLRVYKGIGHKVIDEKPILVFPEGKTLDDYLAA